MPYLNEIHQRVFKIWGLITLAQKLWPCDFFMKILSPWPWPQGHPRGGNDADKNFRPISTIMPNMNEIHKGSSKYEVLINFNAKNFDPMTERWTNELTKERTYERTCKRKEKRKLYTPTYFVCLGYKYEWIKLQWMDGQTNRFLADNYICSTFQLGDNKI